MNEREQCRTIRVVPCAYYDEIGHSFRFMSDTNPMISDSCRSEATLLFLLKGVSDMSQGFYQVN